MLPFYSFVKIKLQKEIWYVDSHILENIVK